MKRGRWFTLIALPTLAFASPAGSALTVKVDAGAFPVIRLDVEVFDGAGRFVAGLQPSAFQVFEGGRPVNGLEVLQIPKADARLGVVLAIDNSGSLRGEPIERAKDAAIAFLDSLGPFDRAGVVTFGDTVRTIVPVGSHNRKPIRALGADESFTHLYDGILGAAKVAARIKDATRKAVVVLTDGHDEGSSVGSIDALLRQLPPDVSVHSIGLRTGVFDAKPLRRVSSATSGTYRDTPNRADLLELYQAVAADLSSSYQLSYTAEEEPARDRNVAITVAIPGGEAAQTEAIYTPPGEPPSPAPDRKSSPLSPLVIGLAGGSFLLLLVVLLLLIRRARRRRPAEQSVPGGPMPVPATQMGFGGPALVAGVQRFPLTVQEVVVGRDAGATIRLEDGSVSRLHARIWRGPGETVLEDLGSTNGTFLNGERVTSSQLHHQDHVRFGDVEFIYEDSVR